MWKNVGRVVATFLSILLDFEDNVNPNFVDVSRPMDAVAGGNEYTRSI